MLLPLNPFPSVSAAVRRSSAAVASLQMRTNYLLKHLQLIGLLTLPLSHSFPRGIELTEYKCRSVTTTSCDARVTIRSAQPTLRCQWSKWLILLFLSALQFHVATKKVGHLRTPSQPQAGRPQRGWVPSPVSAFAWSGAPWMLVHSWPWRKQALGGSEKGRDGRAVGVDGELA